MPRYARAAILYDIFPIMQTIKEDDCIEGDKEKQIQAFLEKSLFDICGFNVVRSLPDCYFLSPVQEYMKWKIPKRVLLEIFFHGSIPLDLRCEQCYVFIRAPDALIVYP